MHLDEVLTMSARLAVLTGDSKWEDRYVDYEPKLDTAIKSALQLTNGSGVSETDLANQKLVNMEVKALKLLNQGKSNEAKLILFSKEYSAEKEKYASGMKKLEKNIEANSSADINARDRDHFKDIVFGVAAIVLLSLVWLFIVIYTKKVLKQNSELFKEVELLAATDSLTGLMNRRSFIERAEKEYSRAIRYERSFAILMIDIDKFKNINDQHGHDIGDTVLKAVSKQLSSSLRQVDIVSRWGGEEFIALLPETWSEQAATVADKIRTSVGSLMIEGNDGKLVSVSLSAGVAASSDKISLEEVIRRADNALYSAKNAGRNTVRVYEGESHTA
ncbi:MAG: hypothetical protein CO187_04385 [Zetaproteobacteria bacterium CG_4_9_14_3_um_filter_53_7]|nr:MAG: hypothetical protein CO187_04385 [Zetaproteobacteria bacterium CG_4_9_14_3_um_filter_53_7]